MARKILLKRGKEELLPYYTTAFENEIVYTHDKPGLHVMKNEEWVDLGLDTEKSKAIFNNLHFINKGRRFMLGEPEKEYTFLERFMIAIKFLFNKEKDDS